MVYIKKEVYGYGFDIWVFSVLQEYDENKLPANDELKYEAVAYKGKDSFALLSSENCGYFNVPWQKTSESDICSVEIDSDYVNSLEKIIRCIVALSSVRDIYTDPLPVSR